MCKRGQTYTPGSWFESKRAQIEIPPHGLERNFDLKLSNMTQSFEDTIKILESEWEPGIGFFCNLRDGKFSPQEFERALQKLSSIPKPRENDCLPRRFVSLLWYIPQFMDWQTERIQAQGGDIVEYMKARNAVDSVVTDILGAP
ncbi:MAG: hypothetical protein V1821_02750 [bacterium]